MAAIPRGTALCPKVRLADIVTVSRDAWHEYGRPISGKHLDYVLVDAETTAILLVVELDERSHGRRDRRERDAFVGAVLASAGIPVVRVRAAASYGAEIRGRLDDALGRSAPSGARPLDQSDARC